MEVMGGGDEGHRSFLEQVVSLRGVLQAHRLGSLLCVSSGTSDLVSIHAVVLNFEFFSLLVDLGGLFSLGDAPNSVLVDVVSDQLNELLLRDALGADLSAHLEQLVPSIDESDA